MAEIAPGAASSSPAGLTAAGINLTFAANNGTNGSELWSRTNPTSSSALNSGERLVPSSMATSGAAFSAERETYWPVTSIVFESESTTSAIAQIPPHLSESLDIAGDSRSLPAAGDGTGIMVRKEPWIAAVSDVAAGRCFPVASRRNKGYLPPSRGERFLEARVADDSSDQLPDSSRACHLAASSGFSQPR